MASIEYRSASFEKWASSLVPFGILFMLGLLVYSASVAGLIARDNWSALFYACATEIICLIYAVVRIYRADKAGAIFDPVIFMATSGAVYFGFGPLIYLFGSADAVNYLQAWYGVSADDAVGLTGLNMTGLGIAGLVSSLGRANHFAHLAKTTSARLSGISSMVIFQISLLIGFVTKYFFVVPYELGLTTEIPSSLMRTLQLFLLVALIAGFGVHGRHRHFIALITWVVLVVDVFVGLLMFNKSVMIMAIMCAGLGHFMTYRQPRSLALFVAAALAVFILVSPLVTYGRNVLPFRPVGLEGRFDVLVNYFDSGAGDQIDSDPDWWWIRLNYLPSQNAAATLYEEGRGGADYKLWPWVIVPRILYPYKPILSDSGVDLNEKISGSRLSSAGVGIFVDGYYNLGLVGFLITSITYGWLLRFFRDIGRQIVRSGAMVMYPLVLMGVSAGVRTDGWWLAEVPAAFVMALVLLGLYQLLPK